MKHIATAIAYLQGALHELDQERKENGSRELSVAYTEIETGLLWLEKAREFKDDEEARQLYLQKRQPYMSPEMMAVADLEKLTAGERIGMFGYDPLEPQEQEA